MEILSFVDNMSNNCCRTQALYVHSSICVYVPTLRVKNFLKVLTFTSDVIYNTSRVGTHVGVCDHVSRDVCVGLDA